MAVFGVIGGGVIMILSALSVVPSAIKDPSPTGAAWGVGSWKRVVAGFFLGIGIAVSYVVFAAVVLPEVSEDSLGPLTKMAYTPGVGQMAWVILALAFAPPVEELLFRGIVYGGYRQSLGPVAAAIITTGGFVALHITELLAQPLAILGVGSLGLGALWIRLRSGAIGPAVAAHLGYNMVVAVLVVLATRMA